MSKSYYQDWYEKNGKNLSARRKERYATDPEYRSKILSRNKETRSESRKVEEVERTKAYRARRITSTGSWKTVDKTVEIDGEKVTIKMFTIGAVAKAIGRGISTVRVWEREGLLPKTSYRSDKGDRLYTLDAVTEMRRVLRSMGRLGDQRINRRKNRTLSTTRKVQFSDGSVLSLPLYKIGSLAKAVDRTVVALVQMEKAERLPRTTLLASKLQYRLYTVGMIEVVREAMASRGGRIRGKADWEAFFCEIQGGWSSMGVIGAVLKDEVKDESEVGAAGDADA